MGWGAGTDRIAVAGARRRLSGWSTSYIRHARGGGVRNAPSPPHSPALANGRPRRCARFGPKRSRVVARASRYARPGATASTATRRPAAPPIPSPSGERRPPAASSIGLPERRFDERLERPPLNPAAPERAVTGSSSRATTGAVMPNPVRAPARGRPRRLLGAMTAEHVAARNGDVEIRELGGHRVDDLAVDRRSADQSDQLASGARPGRIDRPADVRAMTSRLAALRGAHPRPRGRAGAGQRP